MEFYKRTTWKNKRRAILSRDQYRCTNCRRYGKFTEANTVHHILPREYFPEFSFANWNLTSLCGRCHNEMHDRDSHQLTDKGWKLLERTARVNCVRVDPGLKELVTVGR